MNCLYSIVLGYFMLSTSCFVFSAGDLSRKEIECKFTISEPIQYGKFCTWVKGHAKSHKSVKQTDHYLVGPRTLVKHNDKLGFKDVQNTLRIREQGDKCIINMKYRHMDSEGTITSVDEDEIQIAGEQKNGIFQIFRNLGYGLDSEDLITIAKNREIYLVEVAHKKFEIVFDNVLELGEFIEIELKYIPDSVQDGMQAIYDLLSHVGVTEIRYFKRGYPHMFFNKDKDVHEFFGEALLLE